MKTLLTSVLLIAQPILAAKPIDGFTHVRTVGGVEEYRLEANHLRVLLLPQPGMPTRDNCRGGFRSGVIR